MTLPEAKSRCIVFHHQSASGDRNANILNARQPDAPVNEGTLNVRLFRALKKMHKLWQTTFGESESAS